MRYRLNTHEKNGSLTVAIWLGFPYEVSLLREGVGRFALFFVSHMLRNYPVKFEIWCYECNYEAVRHLFAEVLDSADYKDRISFYTERRSSLSSALRFKFAFAYVSGIAQSLLYSWRHPHRIFRQGLPEMRGYFLRSLVSTLGYLLLFSGFIAAILRRVFLRNAGNIQKNVELDFGPEPTGVIPVRESFNRSFGVVSQDVSLEAGGYEFVAEHDVCSEQRHCDLIISADGADVLNTPLSAEKTEARCYFFVSRSDHRRRHRFKIHSLHAESYRLKNAYIRRLSQDTLQYNAKLDFLARIANRTSNAGCFVIPIMTLFNSIALKSPRLVMMHDLAPLVYTEDFLKTTPLSRSSVDDIYFFLNKYQEEECFFCSNSEFVRNEHVRKYSMNKDQARLYHVYLPANIPDTEPEPLKDDCLGKYGIIRDYIFYPSHLRPYKNVLCLIKAFHAIIRSGTPLQLVLTGALRDDVGVEQYVREQHLESHLVLTGSVSEDELYSLHAHAQVTVVPTFFEGGFPWQALEALLVNTPVVLSDIPVVRERLLSLGLSPENSGLKLFDPHDERMLEARILEVLNDRDGSIQLQTSVRAALLSYTWKEATRQYYQLLERIMNLHRDLPVQKKREDGRVR